MTTPLQRVLDALHRVNGQEPRRSGSRWVAPCPGHADCRPSLSIAEGEDNRVLLRCFGGCPTAAVIEAAGLTWRDLFPVTSVTVTKTPRHGRVRKGFGDGDTSCNRKTYTAAREAIAELERSHGKRSATWTYRNAAGAPVGLIVRWDGVDGKKILPVSRVGAGWIVGGMPIPRPLYGLRDLGDAQRVYIVEGEKAADAARSVGLISTTSAHGSNSAGKTDWSPLAGKECVILPDNDAAGWRYADEVAAILARLRPEPVVKIVELPDLSHGGDMADFVTARGVNQ